MANEDGENELEHEEAAQLAHRIGDILHGHTGNVVQRTFGILLVTAAGQEIIDIPDLCEKAQALLPSYVARMRQAGFDQ